MTQNIGGGGQGQGQGQGTKCRYCGKSFGSQPELREHEKRTNEEDLRERE